MFLNIVQGGVVKSSTQLSAAGGTTITTSSNGRMTISSESQAGSYELPIATESLLGGVMIGDNLTIDEFGRLSANVPDAVTTADITSDVNVGGVSVGDVIFAGTNIQEALVRLLTKTYNPTFVNPSFKITNNAGIREIGETISFTLTGTYNPGAINIKDGNGVETKQNNRAGAVTNYTMNGTTSASSTRTVNGYVVQANNSFAGYVDHAEGPQPRNSKGQNFDAPYPSGRINASTSFTGGLRTYAGWLTAVPGTGAQLRTNLLSTSVINQDNEFSLDTVTDKKVIVIAIPAHLTLVHVWNRGTNEFIQIPLNSSIVSIPDAAGTATSYKVYTREFPDYFRTPYTFDIKVE